MKYEIIHDIIASQVYAKATDTQRRRQQIKRYVEERCAFFEDEEVTSDGDNTSGLLTAAELARISAYSDDVNFTPQALVFIEKSRKAVATEAELELARVKTALEQEKITKERELSLAAHRDQMREQVIWRTRVAIWVVSLLSFCLFLGGFYVQTAFWRAKASEAVARAVRAFNVDGDITAMYAYAKEAMYYDEASAEAQEQFYQSTYDSDRRRLLYYTNINTDSQIEEETGVVSHNERYFAAPSNDSTVVIYDLTLVDAAPITLDSLPKGIVGIAFSTDDYYLAVATQHSVNIYNIATHKKIKSHDFGDENLSFIGAERRRGFVIVGEKMVAQWAFITQNKPQMLPLPNDLPKTAIFTSASISQDGRFLVAEHDNGGFHTLFVMLFLRNNLVQLGAISNIISSNFDEEKNQIIVLKEAQLQQYLLNEEALNKPSATFFIGNQNFFNSVLVNDFLVTNHQDIDSIFNVSANGIRAIGRINKRNKPCDILRYSSQNDANFLLLSCQNKAFLYTKNENLNELSERTMLGHRSNIIFRQVLKKTNRVLSVGQDGNIKIWYIKPPCVFDLEVNKVNIAAAHTDFSRSEAHLLAVEAVTNLVYIWETARANTPRYALRASLPFSCFSPDSRSVVVPYGDKINLYNLPPIGANNVKQLEKISSIDLKSPILSCKRAESGQSIFVTTQNGYLFALNANESAVPIDTLAIGGQSANTGFKKSRLQSPIDSAANSADGRYIIVYSATETILIDTKAAQGNKKILKIATDTPLAIRFSIKSDRLMVATKTENNAQSNTQLYCFNTNTMKKTGDSLLIKGNIVAETLQFGKTPELILYQKQGFMTVHRFNTKKTTIYRTDLLRYLPATDSWLVSFANKVSSKRQPRLFGVYSSINDAIRNLEKAAIAVKKEGKKYNNTLAGVTCSADGKYCAVLQNNSLGFEKQNVFTIYNEQSKTIAVLSAAQAVATPTVQRIANLQFSPKGNYIYTKNTTGGVKLWYWNPELIKKEMEAL